MPGLTAFRRRWSVGSDDLIGSAVFMAVSNAIWIIVLGGMIGHINAGPHEAQCIWYSEYLVVTVAVLLLALVCDIIIAVISGKGGVLEVDVRQSIQYFLYVRLGILVMEFLLLLIGFGMIVASVTKPGCNVHEFVFKVLCAAEVCNLLMVFGAFTALIICFDSSGRAFQRLQETIQHHQKQQEEASNMLTNYKQSLRRNQTYLMLRSQWKVEARKKWVQRFSCFGHGKPNEKTTFADIALLMASMFDDVDLVLTDFVAGMILLRVQQKRLYERTISQPTNDVYQYLSGAAVSPRTKFLSLKDAGVHTEYSCMIHFLEYAVASYGWQGQCVIECNYNWGCGKVCGRCPGCFSRRSEVIFMGDNCCQCQYTAITQCAPCDEKDFVYANYENDLQLPSYYVCLDHTYRKVVLCVRGTMSIADMLTDLQADCEEIKVEPAQPTWQGHKGMVIASMNLHSELLEEQVLDKAFSRAKGDDYTLMIIGHSLGAGVAAILAFLLRSAYPKLYCYSFSPPGGLLSADTRRGCLPLRVSSADTRRGCLPLSPDAMEESKKFTTSVVLGKDIVPRIGCAQLEYLRSDVLRLLKDCKLPKWRILSSSLPVFGHCCSLKASETQFSRTSRSQNYSPYGCNTLSSTHQPMFPPGRIIHIVKNYPKDKKNSKPVYQAIWSQNASFDSIVVSPSMLKDHAPGNVLYAMKQVLQNYGPRKPNKCLSESERQAMLESAGNYDITSRDSGLSWEYTCQSEADVALKTPADENNLIVSFMSGEGSDRPSQWSPAPLASQEDLLSLQRSDSDTASNRGANNCAVHLPSDSLQDDHCQVASAPQNESTSCKSTSIVQRSVPSSPTKTMSVLMKDSSGNYQLAFTSTSDLPASPSHYVPQVGQGNQVEYSSITGHYSPAGRGYPHGSYASCDNETDQPVETVTVT